MRFNLLTLPLLSGMLTLAGCEITKSADDSGSAFDDADADTDTDADSDADSDADTDTDVPWLGQATYGGISYGQTSNDALVCDASIQFEGGAYTGSCSDCDYAFAVTSDTVVDNSTEDCSYVSWLSFVPTDAVDGFILAHASDYYVSTGYYDALVNNALLLGYHYSGSGPYWRAMIYDGSAYGEAVTTGSAVSWNFNFSGAGYDYYSPYYTDYCGEYMAESEQTAHLGGTVTGTSTLSCDAPELDVWEISAPSGGALAVSVDTVSAATAFDPFMRITGPDGCTTNYSDDNFDCTYPPPEYSCPADAVTTEEGVYQIAVLSYGSCAGDEGEYELSVNADWAAELTQVADDHARFPYEETEYAINGCAEIVEESDGPPADYCTPEPHGLGDGGGDDTGGADIGADTGE